MRTPSIVSTLFLACVLLIAGGVRAATDVPAGARGAGAYSNGEPSVEARLLVDASAVSESDEVRVGVLFEMAPGWHLYWRNSGEAGFPTTLDWQLPGAQLGPLQWPAPTRFLEADDTVTVYGYADSVLLFANAALTESRSSLDVAVDADFLVCKIECVPGQVSLHRSVPVAVSGAAADAETHALFERWSKRVPESPEAHGLMADALYSQSAIRPGDSFAAAISLVCEHTAQTPGCSGLRPSALAARDAFIPDAMPGIRLSVTGTREHPFADGLLVTLTGSADAAAAGAVERLRGVVQLRDFAGDWLGLDVDLELPRAAAGAAVVALDNPWLEPDPAMRLFAGIPWWQAVGFALLGGLILNLMPCVLPVLAIKVFGIVERAHADRRDLLLNGAAYTLGILATMGALAAVVIGLRAAGTSVGWGFQFREPLFVASIAALLLVFALNLFGVFEIGLPGGRLAVSSNASGLRASFFEGLLAVLLATPCSAPFLGTAVGFAFASSAPVILGIFLAIGLGLAAPFAAITLVPGLASLLPRSGPWMHQLRLGLGFALLGTLIWLLWIVSRTVGSDGLTLLLAFLLALGLGVWLFGRRQRASLEGRAPLAASVLTLLALVGLFALPLEPAARAEAPTGEALAGRAKPFSRDAVQSELAAGRPVFVYFTADWCLTCKLNERVVLSDSEVVSGLAERDVASYVADWTLRDDAIRSELARFQRAGVPVYLIYDPERPASPRMLPELLSVDLFLDALRELDG